jgi:hypothetical protein
MAGGRCIVIDRASGEPGFLGPEGKDDQGDLHPCPAFGRSGENHGPPLAIKQGFEYDESWIRLDRVGEAGALQANGRMIKVSIPGGYDLPREARGIDAGAKGWFGFF